VSDTSSPFVRRSAFVAASELLRAIPPPVLAGSMLQSEATGGEAHLVGRLQVLQLRLRAAYEGAADAVTRELAGGCLALQSELADGALASLTASKDATGLVDLAGSGTKLRSQIILPPW
jgi:hypothetical protein